jgi:hypothetical protein
MCDLMNQATTDTTCENGTVRVNTARVPIYERVAPSRGPRPSCRRRVLLTVQELGRHPHETAGRVYRSLPPHVSH